MFKLEYLKPENLYGGFRQSLKDIKKLKDIGNVLYWDILYTISFSSGAGLTNGVVNAQKGESFQEGFGHAYCNHFVPSLGVNLAYPTLVKLFCKTKHPRLYSNILSVGINLGFLTMHYYRGTENPVATTAPLLVIGLVMTNKQVTDDLEKKVKPSKEEIPIPYELLQ